jgi:hypothetical protein
MNQLINTPVTTGKIVYTGKIAAHSWHLKIAAAPHSDPDSISGYALPVLVGDTWQRFPVWNVDTIHHVLEIVVTAGINDPVYQWVTEKKPGDMINMLQPMPLFSDPPDTETCYLIGNVYSLAFLYQVNRNLPFVKNVESFILSDVAGAFFPDTDKSYPFNYEVVYPYTPERVLDVFAHTFKKQQTDSTIFLLADTATNNTFARFFTQDAGYDEKQIKIVTFENILIH